MKHLRLLASVFALALATIVANAAVGDTFEDETTLLEYQIVTENQNDKTGTIKVIGYIRSYPLAYKWAWAKQSIYVYDDQFGDYCDIYPKELYPYEGDYPEWAVLTIPETITKNNITYTVTEIGDKALAREFANDRGDNFLFQINGPVKIIIPKTINKIGTGAFKYLVKLTSVEFSEQTNIEEIPEECFMQCSHLVTVKNISPIRIKRSAFNACSALQLDESFGTQNLTHIGPLAFCSAFVNNYSFYINSDNLIDIDTMAFERNHSKEIHVKHVSNIRYKAFAGYANKVFLPYEIDTIETSAFRAIPLSTVSPSIKLPDDEENILHFPNLKFFGSSVFYDNNKISSVF